MQVNILTWFIIKSFGWKFDWKFQVVGLSVAVSSGWLAKYLSVSILLESVILTMAISGIIYITLIMISLYFMPWLIGVSRLEMKNTINLILSFKKVRLNG